MHDLQRPCTGSGKSQPADYAARLTERPARAGGARAGPGLGCGRSGIFPHGASWGLMEVSWRGGRRLCCVSGAIRNFCVGVSVTYLTKF